MYFVIYNQGCRYYIEILEQNISCLIGKLQITIIDLVKVTYYNLVVKMHEIVI